MAEEPDVRCTSCDMALRPENALMRDGKPYCDLFCYEHQDGGGQTAREIPLAPVRHHDGTIHIYVDGQDSGLSIGLEPNKTLIVSVDESKRVMKVKGR